MSKFFQLSLAVMGFLFAATAAASELNLDRYDIYYGDVNSDGKTDVYFHGKSQFVLIHSDISVPIFMPPPQSFVVYNDVTTFSPGDGLGNINWPFSNLVAIERLSESIVSTFDELTSGSDYYFGDFNGDGVRDVWVLGSALSNPVYGSATNMGFIFDGAVDLNNPHLLADLSSRLLSMPDPRTNTVLIFDHNGDNKDDFVYVGSGIYADVVYLTNTENVPSEKLVIKYPEARPANVVGATDASFRTNESGAANYNINIQMPAGTAGVTPDFSLIYSSQGSNGLVGKGWTLAGNSAISRCRQTLTQDNNEAPITWTENDRFCIDGQRLMVVEGTYGFPGSVYMTEVGGDSRVSAIGGVAGNPDYFKLELKDGSFTWYGITNDSKDVAHNGKTFSWSKSEYQDSVGNAIRYVYQKDSLNGFRLKEVLYGFGQSKNILGDENVKVEFLYEERPDIRLGFFAGYKKKEAKRLAEINVKIKNNGAFEVLRNYHLAYMRTADPTALGPKYDDTSYLAHVQECVSNQCLPANKFEWSILPAPSFPSATSSFGLDPGNANNHGAWQFGDFNGDGTLDLAIERLYKNSGAHYYHYLEYRISTASGTQISQSSPFDLSLGKTHFYSSSADYRGNRWTLLDYNNDGRSDIVVWHENLNYFSIYLSTYNSSTGNWQVSNTPITDGVGRNPSSDHIFADINGDGLVDAVSSDSYWLLERDPSKPNNSNTPYHFGAKRNLSWDYTVPALSVPAGGGIETEKTFRTVGDFNGDGATDVVVTFKSYSWRWDENMIRKLPVQTVEETHLMVLTGDELSSHYKIAPSVGGNLGGDDRIQVGDFNSDGLNDIFFSKGNNFYYQLNNGAGFEPVTSFPVYGPVTGAIQITDYNSDGYPDIIYKNNYRLYAALWDGDGFSADRQLTVTNRTTAHNWELIIGDISSDGRPDFLQLVGNSGTYYPSNEQRKPNGLITSFTNSLGAVTKVDYEALNHTAHYRRVGYECDLVEPCNTDINQPLLRTSLLNPIELVENEPTLGLNTPVMELFGPFYVVTKVVGDMPSATENPGSVDILAKSSIEYFYGEGFVQAGGRGFLGFKSLATLEPQTGVRTLDEYRIDFPFIGKPLRTEVRTASGDLLSQAHSVWGMLGYDQTWGDDVRAQGTVAVAPLRTHLAQSEEIGYANKTSASQLTPIVSQDYRQKITASFVYDEFLNLTSSVEETTGGGSTFRKETVHAYGTSTYEKQLGRLSRTEVSHLREEGGTTQQTTRTSEFNYYHISGGVECMSGPLELNGLLCQEIVEPDQSEYTVTTTYEYDNLGNNTKAIQSAVGEVSRTSENQYDVTGRYIDRTYNALSHLVSEVEQRNSLGLPSRIRDANGVVTNITHDVFGREIYKVDNTGASVSTDYLSCSNISCPTGAVYAVEQRQSGGKKAITYYDQLARKVREGQLSFNGQWAYTDTEYDGLGREKRKSEAFYAGATPQFWLKSQYDMLGRAVRIDMPNDSYSLTSYDGLTTTTTNSFGHDKIEYSNANGELIKVEDDAGTQITYEYDAQGNLLFVKFPGRADLTIAVEYDLLGRKKSMSDPDKGDWTYEYTKFGELKKQTDAKNQVVTIAYDQLGRTTERLDRKANGSLENYTRWYYDTLDDQGSTVNNALGQITAVVQSTNSAHAQCNSSTAQYCERYVYDQFGRGKKTKVMLGSAGSLGSYESSVEFDTIGRVARAFDVLGHKLSAQSNGALTSGTYNTYNNFGYLQQVNDIASGNLLHKIESTNVRGNVTAERLANQAITNYGYNEESGLLETQIANLSNLFKIQDITYEWDKVSNLKNRSNASTNPWTNQAQVRRESFCYDNLNRLIKTERGTTSFNCSSLSASQQDFQYDTYGNITKKVGVGNYTYGANAGPHAVTYTSDGVNYYYDANGNMTSDSSGRSLLYTTFDKPYQITKGNHQINFKYGPSRSRYERVDQNTETGTVTTTQYLGSIERVVKSNTPNVIEWKRYLPGGAMFTVTTTVASNGLLTQTAEDKSVMYQDHLGSTDVITDLNGTVIHAMSFDPWGERRDAWTWNQLTISEVLSYSNTLNAVMGKNATTKGFTGHEMLDEVGLIHMNGRVYDPRLSRFLQADPFVQAAADTQMFNRYSYMRNNPLNGTDPSGYYVWVVAAIAWALYGIGVIETVMTVALIIAAATAIQVAAAGGDFGEALSAALISFALTYVGGTATEALGNEFLAKVIVQGIVGGMGSALNGGSFGDGFKGAGVAALLGGAVGTMGKSLNEGGRFVAQLVAGGTASKASGGKFANGAMTAAFSMAVNSVANKGQSPVITGAGDGDDVPTELDDPRVKSPEVDYSKSWNTYGEAKEALLTDISKAIEAGNKKWEYGGLTVRGDVDGTTVFYNTNVVTSESPHWIAWHPKALTSINAITPIQSLNHFHPRLPHRMGVTAGGAQRGRFSPDDFAAWKSLKAFSEFEGLYMFDASGPKVYRGGVNSRGSSCEDVGIASC